MTRRHRGLLYQVCSDRWAADRENGFIQHNFLVPGLELLFESNDSHTWRKNHLCENIFKWFHCPSCTSRFFFSVSSQPLHWFLGLSFFSKPLRATYLFLCSPCVLQVVVVLYNCDIWKVLSLCFIFKIKMMVLSKVIRVMKYPFSTFFQGKGHSHLSLPTPSMKCNYWDSLKRAITCEKTFK